MVAKDSANAFPKNVCLAESLIKNRELLKRTPQVQNGFTYVKDLCQQAKT